MAAGAPALVAHGGAAAEPPAADRYQVVGGLVSPLLVRRRPTGRPGCTSSRRPVASARGRRAIARHLPRHPRARQRLRGEQGLLGLAFAPDFRDVALPVGHLHPQRRRARARAVPRAPTASAASVSRGHPATILVVPHPTYQNHNGGNIAFGPDGKLYLGTGDGGGGGDPPHNAQNLPFAARARCCASTCAAAPRSYCSPASTTRTRRRRRRKRQIWMVGLRNPWRWSFDTNGTQWIGDVGQDAYEEVTAVPRSQARAPTSAGRAARRSAALPSSRCCVAGRRYCFPQIERLPPRERRGCPASALGRVGDRRLRLPRARVPGRRSAPT